MLPESVSVLPPATSKVTELTAMICGADRVFAVVPVALMAPASSVSELPETVNDVPEEFENRMAPTVSGVSTLTVPGVALVASKTAMSAAPRHELLPLPSDQLAGFDQLPPAAADPADVGRRQAILEQFDESDARFLRSLVALRALLRTGTKKSEESHGNGSGHEGRASGSKVRDQATINASNT